uniref:Uncharacterized protein n=1 Tax=Trypanosoma congolense (strain IL3000) TaxID=1068625 RepID=G0USD5_TRYCI|nr:conserved hypothetical protein [Trypanosoma congolense IL3000]
MALLFPQEWDTEELVWFATNHLDFITEDIGLLREACESIVVDIRSICNFVWEHPLSPLTNAAIQPTVLDASTFPIHYCHSVLPDLTSSSPSPVSAASVGLPRSGASFRPSRMFVSSVVRRLETGKSTLKALDRKYGYALSVPARNAEKRAGAMRDDRTAGKVDLHNELLPTEIEKDTLLSGTVHFEGGPDKAAPPIHCVKRPFSLFMQVLDALLNWGSSTTSVLDGKHTVPLSGNYVVHESPEDGDDFLMADRSPALSVESPSQQSEACGTSSRKELSNTFRPTGAGLTSTDGNGPIPASRRLVRALRVTVYEIHDVRSVFMRHQSQLSLFYDHEYTFYDPRVKRRLLLSSYYRPLERAIDELGAEIEQLERLEVSLARGRSNEVIIVFRPSIHDFRYMRDSLFLYWGACLTEDDITTYQYFSTLYHNCVTEAGVLFEMLKQLRRPQVDMAAASQIPAYTMEERGALRTGFEGYCRLRERVLELGDSLKNDIENKNRTHRFQIPDSFDFSCNIIGRENGVGRIARKVLSKVFSFSEMLLCSAEAYNQTVLNETRCGSFVLSDTSPQYEPKLKLLHHMRKLIAAVEIQGTILEKDYPGVFYRDTKALWKERAASVVRHLETVSIVFSKPS